MPFGPPGGFFVPASDFGSTQAQALGMEAHMTRQKMTILALQDKKARGEPITMITAYDYPGALAADRLGLPLNAAQRHAVFAAGPCAGMLTGCGRGQAGNRRLSRSRFDSRADSYAGGPAVLREEPPLQGNCDLLSLPIGRRLGL